MPSRFLTNFRACGYEKFVEEKFPVGKVLLCFCRLGGRGKAGRQAYASVKAIQLPYLQ